MGAGENPEATAVTQDSIRSYEQVKGTLKEFETWLRYANVEAMDIDVLVERFGHFVLIESKVGRGRFRMNMGEIIAYRALAERDGFYVILAQEDAPDVLPSPNVRIRRLLPNDAIDPEGIDTTTWARLTKRALAESLRRWLDAGGVAPPDVLNGFQAKGARS